MIKMTNDNLLERLMLVFLVIASLAILIEMCNADDQYNATTFMELSSLAMHNWTYANQSGQIFVPSYTVMEQPSGYQQIVPDHYEILTYSVQNVKANVEGWDLFMQLQIVEAASLFGILLILVIRSTYELIMWLSARRRV